MTTTLIGTTYAPTTPTTRRSLVSDINHVLSNVRFIERGYTEDHAQRIFGCSKAEAIQQLQSVAATYQAELAQMDPQG